MSTDRVWACLLFLRL